MFERLLDELAVMIEEHLRKDLQAELGCALLYRGKDHEFYLGGSSSDRRKIRRLARLYNLSPNAKDEAAKLARKSFTGFAIQHYISFVLDNFKDACDSFKSIIQHEEKKVEIRNKGTESYYFFPVTSEETEPGLVRNFEELKSIKETTNVQVTGGIRISSNEPGVATQLKYKLGKDFLGRLSKIIDSGAKAIGSRDHDYALAIADFQSDLLKYRLSEFSGLETLAFHLQSLFASSECSVFVANEAVDGEGQTSQVFLNLAATTALTDTKEHQTFRRKFFDEGAFYCCKFDSERTPIVDKDTTKTEEAYFFPNRTVMVNSAKEGETKSKKFYGFGEIPNCPSYLAVAIPSLDGRHLPYGVIRIVREVQSAFEEDDSRLAMAVARALAQWVQFFPKNPALEIHWKIDEPDKLNVIQGLFDLPRFGSPHLHKVDGAEQELTWLLQKIFTKSKRIQISDILSGRSNSTVLKVKNDHGLDLILKCSQISQSQDGKPDQLTQEIRNYQDHVEGKLPLNHNIIYPELIRETRRLKGFATSFLVPPKGVRLSLTEYCNSPKINHADFEWALTRVVEKLVSEVWAWWYKSENMEKEVTCRLQKFLEIELLEKDPLFEFFHNMDKFDNLVIPFLANVLWRKDYKNSDGDWPTPKDLWETFLNDEEVKKLKVTWQATVTHGDTHGDNIFFDPRSMEMWIIDFGRTGPRPNVFDLAMIEADLKFQQLARLIGKKEHIQTPSFINQFRNFEQALASQKSYENLVVPIVNKEEAKLSAIAKVVVDIRQLACQKLGRSGSFTDYKLISLLLGYKYMKLGNASPECKAMAYISAREIIDSFCLST